METYMEAESEKKRELTSRFGGRRDVIFIKMK